MTIITLRSRPAVRSLDMIPLSIQWIGGIENAVTVDFRQSPGGVGQAVSGRWAKGPA
jgi:hypothetical protein